MSKLVVIAFLLSLPGQTSGSISVTLHDMPSMEMCARTVAAFGRQSTYYRGFEWMKDQAFFIDAFCVEPDNLAGLTLTPSTLDLDRAAGR